MPNERNHTPTCKVVHSTTLAMEQEGISTSCTHLWNSRSNEGGIADRGIKRKFNFLESLRAPITRKEVKNDDIYMKTNDSWRSKGSKDPNPYANYQKNLNRRLSEPKRFEDPYNKIKNSFRSSLGFKNWFTSFILINIIGSCLYPSALSFCPWSRRTPRCSSFYPRSQYPFPC